MSNLGCRITFRPENPVAPSIELLTIMCVMKTPPQFPLPRPANENLKATA